MARRAKYKQAILDRLSAGADPLILAAEFPVTPSYIYKLGKQVREAKRAKIVDATPKPEVAKPVRRIGPMAQFNSGLSAERFASHNSTVPSPYSQLVVSSLRRHGGDVAEEYLRELQGSRGVQIYREMGNDSIIAAVLSAIKMTLRRVHWYADKSPRKEKNKTAKTDPDTGDKDLDFLETCMEDMSLSWSDFIDQALSMLQYGFAPFEIVYKARRGNIPRPGPHTSRSRYTDGKVGWKKLVFIGQDTLVPGNSWIFDDDGSLRGLNQQPPMGTVMKMAHPIAVPIEKMILFRTTIERDSPEGKSVIRPCYADFWYKKNMEEIEAISAERLGSGFPVIYLGENVAKGDTEDSDINEFNKIMRNIRVDEQMGLVIPFAKMGQGMAREGEGVLFELVSPPAKGGIDFGQIIQRHEKRMAMVGLAQFIHLGMDQQGSQALATVTTDFFQLAVSAWADSLEDTINRFLVEPLMLLNGMSTEDHPVIDHGDISTPDLKTVGDYINKTVGAQVITPDDHLEEALRRIAGFPDKDDATARPVMNELDGDGGTRISRKEKASSANNQRNQSPTVEKPQEPYKPEARKPMRASEDDMTPEQFEALNTRFDKIEAAVRDSKPTASGVVINTPEVNIDSEMIVPGMERFKEGIEKFADAVHSMTPVINVQVPTQPTPIVNITTPQPKVEINLPKQDPPNIIVNVPPANVTVDLPQEKSVTRKVNRDEMGRIDSVTEKTKYGE